MGPVFVRGKLPVAINHMVVTEEHRSCCRASFVLSTEDLAMEDVGLCPVQNQAGKKIIMIDNECTATCKKAGLLRNPIQAREHLTLSEACTDSNPAL